MDEEDENLTLFDTPWLQNDFPNEAVSGPNEAVPVDTAPIPVDMEDEQFQDVRFFFFPVSIENLCACRQKCKIY